MMYKNFAKPQNPPKGGLLNELSNFESAAMQDLRSKYLDVRSVTDYQDIKNFVTQNQKPQQTTKVQDFQTKYGANRAPAPPTLQDKFNTSLTPRTQVPKVTRPRQVVLPCCSEGELFETSQAGGNCSLCGLFFVVSLNFPQITHCIFDVHRRPTRLWCLPSVRNTQSSGSSSPSIRCSTR